MDEEKYQDIAHKLYHDYLDLCESYQDQLPVHEFGFAIIRLVSQMLFDCAPSEMVARETIRVGIEDGFRMHLEEKEDA